MFINCHIMMTHRVIIIYLFIYFFILVKNQKKIEDQLGIHIIDSGIGNPRQVRDRRRIMKIESSMR